MRGKFSQSTCDQDWASSEGARDHSFLFLAYGGARYSPLPVKFVLWFRDII